VKKTSLALCLLLVLVPLSHAVDFGVIVDQSAGYGGAGDDAAADYTGAVVPRFSTLIGEAGDLYVSAGFTVDYGNDVITFVPELLRTEFSWLFSFGGLKAGRMHYADPLRLIADGLFDGAQFTINTGVGTFGAGAWYTGLLYKRRAEIAMTPEEIEAYALEPDYKNFSDSYFAPRRLVAALDWEHLSLGSEGRLGPLQVRAAFIGQFDLGNGGLNSQYLAGKVTLPLSVLSIDLGSCLELLQNNGTFATAAAAEFDVQLPLPTPLQDRLSFMARYSSGGKGDAAAAFLPLTTKAQGEIFEVKLSGISLLFLEYVARIIPALSAGVSSTYFIRSDLETYTTYPPIQDGGGYFLGNEFFARLMWNPFSDLQISLGGGAFLPSMGNAAPDADAAGRIELNVVVGF